ncbi:hypothetical protein DKM19_17965 [Streptosporangium sp. 'caverna']|nr:DUF6461 domain-containing protein [Streptosporangium sp. 'caverna']AWS42972.1 hypothetical protein DKM19_17965 [Streptosporangium sp. 'caverna']
MTATAADYTWFDERLPGLAEAYCFTLIRGLTSEEPAVRLGARTEGFPSMTLEELIEVGNPATNSLCSEHHIRAVSLGSASSTAGETVELRRTSERVKPTRESP